MTYNRSNIFRPQKVSARHAGMNNCIVTAEGVEAHPLRPRRAMDGDGTNMPVGSGGTPAPGPSGLGVPPMAPAAAAAAAFELLDSRGVS